MIQDLDPATVTCEICDALDTPIEISDLYPDQDFPPEARRLTRSWELGRCPLCNTFYSWETIEADPFRHMAADRTILRTASDVMVLCSLARSGGPRYDEWREELGYDAWIEDLTARIDSLTIWQGARALAEHYVRTKNDDGIEAMRNGGDHARREIEDVLSER